MHFTAKVPVTFHRRYVIRAATDAEACEAYQAHSRGEYVANLYLDERYENNYHGSVSEDSNAVKYKRAEDVTDPPECPVCSGDGWFNCVTCEEMRDRDSGWQWGCLDCGGSGRRPCSHARVKL